MATNTIGISFDTFIEFITRLDPFHIVKGFTTNELKCIIKYGIAKNFEEDFDSTEKIYFNEYVNRDTHEFIGSEIPFIIEIDEKKYPCKIEIVQNLKNFKIDVFAEINCNTIYRTEISIDKLYEVAKILNLADAVEYRKLSKLFEILENEEHSTDYVSEIMYRTFILMTQNEFGVVHKV